MSCFMCSPETISDISDYLYKTAAWDNAKLFLALKEEYGSDLTPEGVFQVLFEMNKAAITSQYGKEAAEEMYESDEYIYIPIGKDRKRKLFIEEFKKLECFLYQCNEKGVQGTRIYDILCDILTGMAYGLARSIPEYDKVAWG